MSASPARAHRIIAASGASAAPSSFAQHNADASETNAPESFWVSLSYFNVYRLVLAGFFCSLAFLQPQNFGLAQYAPGIFTAAALAYLAAAVVFQWLLQTKLWFIVQLRAHVLSDVAAIAVLMYASGGFKSGLGVLMLISLVGAALVSDRLNTLLFAALASIALLLEQSLWVLYHDIPGSAFMQPGLLSIGFFVMALIINRLAFGVIHNERMARERGIALANQLRINQLVIRDVQDGVMVVDSDGVVRQHNPQAELLLGAGALGEAPLARYSDHLATQLNRWRAEDDDAPQVSKFVEGGSPHASALYAGRSGGCRFFADISGRPVPARR